MQQPMPGVQIGGQPMPMPGQLPAPLPPPKFHDVTIVTKKNYSCARVMGVPPEEFGISRNARNIADCGYCFHETPRRQSELIEEGYDEKQLETLPTYIIGQTTEALTRDTADESRYRQGDSGINKANRLIMITENYLIMDYEQNNKPRLYRVTTGGGQGDVLKLKGKPDVEEVDVIPFAAMTPVIVTHRFIGKSIADLVMDVQRIKTALVRGLLDNLYAHNMPRAEIAETGSNENTLDDFMNLRHGGMIRVKTAGTVNWQEVPDITGSVYPALQYFDATREWRSGVTRQGQGVDPNALQNQVATIANQMEQASQAKVKLIARIFAETGIKDLFQLLHGVIRKNGQQAETVRLRNKWTNVDPRDWQERNDLTVQVGLGTGTKQMQLAAAQMIGAAQEKMTGLGLVSKKNAYATAKRITNLAGEKDVDQFFLDPSRPPNPNDPASAPIPPPPDPKQAEIQAKAAAEQAKMANDAQHQEKQFQRDTAHQQMKLQGDLANAQMKTQADIALAEKKFELERELALINAQIEREKHEHEMQAKAAQHAMTMQAGAEKHQASMQEANVKAAPAQDMAKSVKDLHGSVQQLHERVAGMEQDAAAPIEIIRDAKTRKMTGAKRGKRQIVIRG